VAPWRILQATPTPICRQFTVKEQDVDTGLDYINARYYASIGGRFTSPDPLLESGPAEVPQSWNVILTY